MSKLPLQGKRIVVTRNPEKAEALGDRLRTLGAIPIYFPTIRFVPLPTGLLDAALAQLNVYGWLIFTSGNAVRFFFGRLEELGKKYDTLKGPLLKVAAGGPATADLLAERGLVVDFVPGEFTGEALVSGLGDLRGQRVLLPRARIGRPEIVQLLQAAGAMVDEVPLYDTVPAVPGPAALAEFQQGVDAITFTSPSSVRNFLGVIRPEPPEGSGNEYLQPPGDSLKQTAIACIGPLTAEEAIRNGLEVTILPGEYTIEGLVQAVVQYFEMQDVLLSQRSVTDE
ncbi:MAG: uroporphyrinogen-III synthase [Chloroflexi bacterium]|nr:uroporphyrinogen-III synthase [Chloroflexota bacterium]MCI0580458.1 uroporphyrinogen-III synthase [Chloroflexota bacterium]MCI0649202.1 uroporphyrinogen-III synthase [Chloroflexota bacterium]MCI0727986.1 uroporphyrinogen-III synthase [Chloroflexota bacterium]